MDYIELLKVILKPIVPSLQDIIITFDESSKTVHLAVESSLIAKLIGKNGDTVNAIRDILNILGSLNKENISLKIDAKQ